MIFRAMTSASIVALGLSAGCLDDKSAQLDCGQGDGFAYAGSDYCIYAAAIIIEGFDCPAAVPFGHEMGDLLICGPSASPPPEGWDALVQAWHTRSERDVSQPETRAEVAGVETDAAVAETELFETIDETDGGPEVVAPEVCVASLSPGECWDAAACPDGWRCEGAAVSCTPCVDCPSPIPGVPGSCRPTLQGEQLGLVAWPDGAGVGHVATALWWIEAAYGLIDCPSFTLEQRELSGEFVSVASDNACSAAVSPPAGAVYVRPGPALDHAGAIVVRARGTFHAGCADATPASCAEHTELLSNEVALPAP